MGKINSKQKGARGERLFVSKCAEHGYKTRRGQQYCGANGDADVVGLPGIHIEVKFTERENIRAALEQSVRDAKENEKPIVASKKNNCEFIISMRAEDWFDLYREWEAGR